MRFDAPEWFLLLAALAAVAWRWPHLQLHRFRRALLLSLLVLTLAQPMFRRAADGIDLWVLIDRSASAAGLLAGQLTEMETLLQRSRGADDRLEFIDYAAEPVTRSGAPPPVLDANQTGTALALQHALTQLRPDRLARLLVLTDGYATEPLSSVGDSLLKRGIPLDYRLLVSAKSDDFSVESLEMPQRVRVDESFVIDARVAGTRDGVVDYEVLRGEQLIGKGTVEVVNGRGRVRLIDRTRVTGAHAYSLRLRPEGDAHPENDLAESWLEVLGGSRVLLLSAFAQDPVADVLRNHGLRLEHVRDLGRLNAGSLSGVRAVIFNNVPAHQVPPEFVGALDFYVREQGGAVMMCGGRSSFGSGGWFDSPLDPLLPVSMELRKEHRKLRVAMAVILDRSGSMAVGVSSGGGTLQKMDLANEGAARTISLLGDNDYVTVFAVDSEPHAIARLTEVGPARDKLVRNTRRIRSAGGGIFVYVGMKAGWEELKRADVGQRHMILFADAADAEEPGDYENLLAEMTAQGATVSVIGLGEETDADAEFLKDIAARGKGRIFFNANAAELPALFAQETVAVARSAFIDEPVRVKATAGWLQIAATPLRWLPQVDGYNLSYLKPEAAAAAISGDEYAAPLVAFWQRGLGRAAAVSFPLAGESSERARGWPGYSELTATLARWLAGDETPAGLALTTKLVGTELQLELFYGDDWTEKVARSEPRLVLSAREGDSPRTLQWEKLAPGHFQARATLRPGELVRGAAQIERTTLPFGPIAAATNAEWQFAREPLIELQTLSRMTGGKERLDLATSWETPPISRFSGIQPWLVVALLLLVVADALLTRLGR